MEKEQISVFTLCRQWVHSRPIRPAPVSHYVGNGLKADVPPSGKTVTLSRVDTVCAVSAADKVKILHARTRTDRRKAVRFRASRGGMSRRADAVEKGLVIFGEQ